MAGSGEGRGQLTFPQLPLPHRDDGPRVLSVVDEPQGQGLHALLRVAQLRQLLLQRRLGEGGHPSENTSTPSHAEGPRGGESRGLVATSPTHPTLPHALSTAAAATTSKSGRKLARWRPAGSDVTAGACPAPPRLALGKEARPRPGPRAEGADPESGGGVSLWSGPGVSLWRKLCLITVITNLCIGVYIGIKWCHFGRLLA